MRRGAGQGRRWVLAGLALSAAVQGYAQEASLTAAGSHGNGRDPFATARAHPLTAPLAAPALRGIEPVRHWAPATLRPVGRVHDAGGYARLLLAPDGALHMVRTAAGTQASNGSGAAGMADRARTDQGPATAGRPS